MKNHLYLSKSSFRITLPDYVHFFCWFILGLLISACEKPKPKMVAAPVTVDVTPVIQKNVPVSMEWVGTLDGMVNAQINAQVTGYLIKRNYKEGELVKKGQLLYEIDPRTFQATLDNARGSLAQQQAVLKTNQLALNRILRLLPEHAVSVLERDNAVGAVASAQAQVLSAQAAVESAELNLGFTKIYSPITGISGISTAQIGDLIGPGSGNNELTTVSQVEPIRAYIGTSEQQYLKIMEETGGGTTPKTELPIQLKLANNQIYPYKGKFFFGNRQVDTNTGTIKVAFLFSNPKYILRPGMYARISVENTVKEALVIPQKAVMQLQTVNQVAVVNADNIIEIRNVKLGSTSGEQVIITEGLKPGEKIVVDGIQKIRAGMKVTSKPYKNPKEIEFSDSSMHQAS